MVWNTVAVVVVVVAVTAAVELESDCLEWESSREKKLTGSPSLSLSSFSRLSEATFDLIALALDLAGFLLSRVFLVRE